MRALATSGRPSGTVGGALRSASVLGAARPLPLALGLFGVLAAACSSPRTAVVVVVETDLSSPAEVASVRATIGEGGCADLECVHDFATGSSSAFPFSFVVEPRDDPSARFTLSIVARDAGGTTTVSREIETGFVPSSTRLLVVHLSRACRGVTCSLTETCSDGACVGRFVDPEDLPTVLPGRELDGRGDAGPGLDAPSADAPPFDAPVDGPSLDAPSDGGTAIPATCFDLPVLAPSGLTLIDPDGAGGEAPFQAWCENEANGGGWTLIAKVDPASSRLEYDAAVWTASSPMPFGTIDESVGDALLRPYWTVPIRVLRVGSDGVFDVLRPTAMVSRGVLRAAMDLPSPLELDATPTTWGNLTADPLHPMSPPCIASGINVAIPATVSPGLAVRIGLVGSAVADCSEPTFWYGLGVRVSTSDARCVASDNNAGGARVCGPPGQRHTRPRVLLVYGR